MNVNINKPALEMTTLPQLAREVEMSPRGLGMVLERNGIVGDAVLIEGRVKSALFLRSRLAQIKKVVGERKSNES